MAEPAVMVRATYSMADGRSRPSSADIRRSMMDRLASVRLCWAIRLRQRQPLLGQGRRVAQHAGDAVELRGDADEVLRERVVQFARDARAFFEHDLEPGPDLAKPQPVEPPPNATRPASTADGNHAASTTTRGA